jgi:membrane-associated protease RseP (regulator of RpoE activity)
LDTGFEGNILLFPDTAEKVGVVAKGSEMQIEPGKILVTEAHVKSIQMLGNHGEHLSVGNDVYVVNAKSDYVNKVLPLLSQLDVEGQPIMGVVGIDLFLNRKIQINFDQKTLGIFPKNISKNHSHMADRTHVDMPLGFIGGKRKKFTTQLKVAGLGNLTLFVDTGASRTSIISHYQDDIDYDKFMVTFATHFGGTETQLRVLVNWLALGSDKLYSVPLSIAGTNSSARWQSQVLDGALGLDILSRYNVTIDHPNGRLLLEKPTRSLPPLEEASELGFLPAQFIYEDSENKEASAWGVYFVIPESPTEKAGLRKGDIITEIGGTPTQKLSEEEVEQRLHNRAYTPLIFKVKREEGGRELIQTITFKSSSEFDYAWMPLPHELGVIAYTAEGRIYVARKGSLQEHMSENQGLPEPEKKVHAVLEGDELLEINSMEANKLSYEKWTRFLNPINKTIEIKVRRGTRILTLNQW